MKHLILVLPFLVSAAAAAQLDPLPPFKPCEIWCTCAPVPGEVDKCSMYPKFVELKKYPPVFPTVTVNPDPGACAAAVKDNVERLSVHFGKSPEISLPTKEMTSWVETHAPPPKGPLPYRRKLDMAASVVIDDSLDKQITLQTVRVLALADDARSFAIVDEGVSQWRSAGVAAQRLSERVEGAEKSLSLATPWPKIQDFAPYVWNLRICQHSKPDEVAALASRIADKDDIAWTFAFARDWIDLQAPFDSKPGAAHKWLHKFEKPNFDMIASPFFAESEIVVNEREEKSLFTLLELRAFRSAVTRAGEGIMSYTQDLESRVNERRKELEVAFIGELNAIERIRDSLKVQDAAVASFKTEVETAIAERAKVQAFVDKFRVDIISDTSNLKSATFKHDQKRVARSTALTEATERRGAVDDALQKLQAIILNCGGETYDTCSDAAAKKDFDRRRYEANQVVAAARTTLTKAQTMLTKIDGELLSDEKAILDLRTKIAAMILEHNTLRSTRNEQDKNLAQLRARLQVREAEMLSLSGQFAKLDKAVEELSKVRPK